jgi:hypothetical protein
MNSTVGLIFIMAKKYAELLRDPRWQKKRLEVFNRDNFKCVKCGDDKSELNVHHYFYDGRDPWDYELQSLETLCRCCHEKKHGKQIFAPVDPIEISEIRQRIKLLRRLIPNSWNPNTEWIEARLDNLTSLLNYKLNNVDQNG